MIAVGFALFLLRLTPLCAEETVSYANYKVYTVAEEGSGSAALRAPHIQQEFPVLSERTLYDRKNHPHTVRSYLIPHNRETAFRRTLDTTNADYTVSSHDLGKEIEEERRSYQNTARRSSSTPGFVGETYYSHDEMTAYLRHLATLKHPTTRQPLALVEPIGRTYEGRTMHLVRVSSDHSARKPAILFEAGIHAREWTAPAAALYMLHQLVENYTGNAGVLRDVDFLVIPLSNPDGYEYSRRSDRLWRKTRSLNEGVYGVDGNRNFDFHWGEDGTSRDPESNIYIGPRPFSERETRNIRDVGRKYLERIGMFVSIHAYGPSIVFPWSFRRMAPAPQSELMDTIGRAAARAIRRYNGTEYVVGISAYLMYAAAGGADDYFKGVLGVDLSFTVELSSGPRESFITPSDRLIGIVAEAFEGFKVMAKYAAGYRKPAPPCPPRNQQHGN